MKSRPNPLTRRRGPPHLCTVPEVAEILRTTPTAIYAKIARGQLPGVVRLSRRVLVDRDELVAWLDQRRAPSSKGK